MKKTSIKTIIIIIYILAPLFSYSASIGKSQPILPFSNCNSGLSCGLVGYWTFDGKDIIRGLVIDKSGNGNHANLSNIATSTFFVPGKIGQGFNFDGSDDALNAGSAAVLDNMSAMTLSVWVKLNSYGAGGGGYLLNKGDNNSGGHGWSLFLSQSNSLISFTARYNTTNLLVQTSANSFTTSDFNKWVHIMVTWDGSSNAATGVHIYKNGNELAYSTQTNGSSSYLSDASDNLNIGDGGLISSRQSNGILDDVRAYNRVLNYKELYQIYSSGALAKQSASNPASVATSTCSFGLSCGLVTYWTFDGKNIVNGVVRDNSGNGTFANIANISTSTFYTAGIRGQAFRFDDNDDYIYSDLGTERSTFTISFWYTPKTPNNWQNNQTGFQMGKTTYSDSNNFRWYSTGGNPKIQASSNNGGTSNLSTTYTSETKNPYLNTFVYTPTQIDWYINGVLYNSTTPSVSTFDPMRFIRIGGTGSANQSVNGIIDDFKIYSKALTVSEIKQLYNSVILTKQSTSQDIIQNSSCVSGLNCGLVGYWTFDGKDMVNGVVQDKSKNAGRGNLKNIATSTFYDYGKIGQGFNFDGVDDYLDVTASATDNLSSFTVCSWIKPKKYQPQSGGFPILVIKGSNDTSNYWDVYLEGSTGPFEFGTSYDNGNKGYFQSGPVILSDVWSHICVIQNGTIAANFLMYFNGESTPNGGDLGGSGGSRPTDTGAHIIIGSDITNNKYSGLIDDVRIYNRALSESEIKQIYNHGK